MTRSSYQALTREAADSATLAFPPISIWIISTLEICVELEGKKALLLTYPSYPIENQRVFDVHDEGYWAPPFVATPVGFGYSPPTTLGSVRALVARAMDQLDVRRDLEQLAYQMGLRDVDLEEREPFLELKVSPRSPELLKAYYILRHGLVGVDPGSVRSLTDSEVRRGYVFCPTDMPETHCRRHFSETHDRDETWLLGKPLQSNIEWVMNQTAHRSRIESSVIRLEKRHFVRQESGVLCAVDVAGYGRALQYAGDSMHSFDVVGAESQDWLRGEVSRLLHELLVSVGTTQAQIAGDGMIAAFPRRVFRDQAQAAAHILSVWTGIAKQLSRLGDSIRDTAQRPGSRMSLLFGHYTYGRSAGLESFMPTFDGQDVIAVARMEQGLATPPLLGAAQAEAKHMLALPADLQDTVGRSACDLGWELEGTFTLVSKEYSKDAVVYSLTGL